MARRMLIFLVVVACLTICYMLYPEKRIEGDIQVDKLVVYKSARKMEAWSSNKVVNEYSISLGDSPIGHKQHQGDEKTPEGHYYIDDKNPNSGYHLNLGISYPNKTDRKNSKKPGGDIKIHGLPNRKGFIGKLHRFVDWTNGCIAVTNEEIEELYKLVPVGTPIIINK